MPPVADLASHCRLLFYNRPKHKLLYRWLLLYPLYALSEIAIISTDLAELLGSAIGLVLLFPKLPLWSAVLLTATDVLVFLIIGDPTRGHGRPVRMFEFSVIILVEYLCFLSPPNKSTDSCLGCCSFRVLPDFARQNRR